MSDIIKGYEHIKAATTIINNQIERSDKYEGELINAKRILEQAKTCFYGEYLNKLAEDAGIDIEAESEAYTDNL